MVRRCPYESLSVFYLIHTNFGNTSWLPGSIHTLAQQHVIISNLGVENITSCHFIFATLTTNLRRQNYRKT